jgi:hypothetical protein
MSYKPGNWLAICDRCGREYLSGELRKMWNGLMVDSRCWEPRHPQEFIHGIKEAIPAWYSNEPADIQINPYLYVAIDYWDNDAVVPPATFTTDQYVVPA